MTTMKEFLTWYNNKDVEPLLEAIDKMYRYYQNQNIDILKDGISVPGPTLKYMFPDLPDYFTLPDEKNKDLYQLYKNNIVGGPSIVFHRYNESDVMTIRPTDYEVPETCKKIIGCDANAHYLWSIMQEMPTEHFVRRKSENQFRRDTPRRYEQKAIEWLEWEAKNTGYHVRHQGNHKEKVIGRRRLPVDGYVKETNTVYEFQRCYWHGHDCHLNHSKPATDEKAQTMDQRYQKTQEKIQYIQHNGYPVKQMWECDWERLKKEDPAVKSFVKDLQRPCDGQFKMTEETILRAVMEDRMFGALEVDLEVPDHLKGKCAEMPPVFKNTHVSREDIGNHMKTYAEERGTMNQKRKCLIGSMYGEKIMVISPLLKWYELVSPERHSITCSLR
jgi:G:T-mismatch repair DNA endonuclease (very short patch repair protein)